MDFKACARLGEQPTRPETTSPGGRELDVEPEVDSGAGSAPQLVGPPTTFQPTGDSTGMMAVRLVEIDEWS